MNDVVVQTLKGTNTVTQEIVEWDLDEVLVNGQRVALVPHAEGAGIRFLRILSAPTVKEIQEAVRKQRAEQGKAPISDATSQPPNPDDVRRLARAAKRGAA